MVAFEGRRRFRVRLNMVPLINVVFLLLIFFMLTGTIRQPEPFNLEIPESTSGDSAEYEPLYEPVEVILAPDGRIAVNGREVPRAGFVDTVSAFFDEDGIPAVSFKADARAGTGEMVDLLKDLRAAGAKLVLLETRPVRNGAE